MATGIAGIGGIINAAGLKDPRASGSKISSAWGNLALTLASAAGAVGIAALEKKAQAGSAGSSVLAKNQLTTPGQPTQKTPVKGTMNKASLAVGFFIVALAVGIVWFAFRR